MWNHDYTKESAEEFIRYLGLWRYPKPKDHLEKRSDSDWLLLCSRVIEVNKSRPPCMSAEGQLVDIGCWETEAAKNAIAELQKKWAGKLTPPD